MGFNCGIVGLPNVGKSTLFNALTATQAAQAANYPFCTIEPNIGRVAVPDKRLEELASIQKTEKIIANQLEFVDIAGLVKGASRGEGLGNQFLANIREVDAIIHVVRCFENSDITHVEGAIDPMRDIDIINTELMIADMQSLEKRVVAAEKKAKGNDKEAALFVKVASPALELLNQGKPASVAFPHNGNPDEIKAFKALNLLTAKPVLYVANVAESEAATGNSYSALLPDAIVISAQVEAEAAGLGDDKAEYLKSIGLDQAGLDKVIRAGFKLLGLQTFFTVGPKEIHAWTVRQGALAPESAGAIHTDFERGFIRAEVISYADFIACRGEAAAKAAGKMRTEGKSYVVQDGDIMHFLFSR